jgi:hypothetical protein
MKGRAFNETHSSKSMVFNEMMLQAPLAEHVVPHQQLTLLFHRSLNYRSKVKTNFIAVLDAPYVSTGVHREIRTRRSHFLDVFDNGCWPGNVGALHVSQRG